MFACCVGMECVEGGDVYAGCGVGLMVETVGSVGGGESGSWFLMFIKLLLDVVVGAGS